MSEQNEAKPWREYRREQAWVLKQQGWKQKDIAEALGVSEGAVSQWRVRGRLGQLAAQPGPGKRPQLSQEDKRVLVEVVQGGAVAAGFEGEQWTQGRVRQIIAARFGVHYSERHVGRVLKQVGLTLQKPARQASQRHEQAILDWQITGWTEVKKRQKPRAIR